MITIKNKVIFLDKKKAGVGNEQQLSSNVQGQLKKKVTRLKKLKTKEKVSVELTGTYKGFEIKIDPADSPHAAKIKAMLKLKQ